MVDLQCPHDPSGEPQALSGDGPATRSARGAAGTIGAAGQLHAGDVRVEASPIFIALRPHFRSRGALWITGDEEDVQMLLLVQFHLDVSEGFVVLHRPPWLMARAHPHAPLKFSLDNTIRIDFDGHPVWM